MGAKQRRRHTNAFSLFAIVVCLTGCNAGGGDASITSGAKTAARATVIAGDQALYASSNYVLVALAQAAPQGSSLRTEAPVSSQTTFIPALNLYRAPGKASGNRLTTTFYTDQALTHPAGTIVETIPSQTTWDTAYKSYPKVVNTDFTITGGNLPAKGHIVTTFTDVNGANTLTGNFTITKSTIVASLNLSRSSIGAISGTVDLDYKGISTTFQHISGKISRPIVADVLVTPNGFTGQTAVQLTNGNYSMSLNVNALRLTASTNAGALSITYSDGTHETINSPLTVAL